ncbi:MAG: flagellar biosynthetic protein FliO [Pirellulales bacterium]
MLLFKKLLPVATSLMLSGMCVLALAQEGSKSRGTSRYSWQPDVETTPRAEEPKRTSASTNRRLPGGTERIAAQENTKSEIVAAPAKPGVRSGSINSRPSILAQPKFSNGAEMQSPAAVEAATKPLPAASKKPRIDAEDLRVSTGNSDTQVNGTATKTRPGALRLAAPTASAPAKGSSKGAKSPGTSSQAIGTTLGSLAIVLGVFFAVSWVCRKISPQAAGPLPKDVLELLGRTSLGGRQQLQLLRLGNKLVLVAVTAAGIETVTEVDDPAEVERILQLCRREQPSSASSSFLDLVSQMEKAPIVAGFVDRAKGMKPASGGRK